MYQEIATFKQYLHKIGTKPETVQAYIKDIQQWGTFCVHNGIDSIHAITQDHVDAYINELKNACVTRKTAQRKMTAIRQFVHFYAPDTTIVCKLPENTLDILCTNDEIQYVCQYLSHYDDVYAYRDACICILVYYTQQSASSIRKLRHEHIQETNNAYSIGKIVIRKNSLAATLLRAYIETYRSRICAKITHETPLLFPYIHRNTACIMPATVYVHRLRTYLMRYRHYNNTVKPIPYNTTRSNMPSDANKLKVQYTKYHTRA